MINTQQVKIALITIFLSLTSAVLVYSAGSSQGGGTLADLSKSFVSTIVKSLASMFFALAVAAFFYGIVKYIWGIREGKEDEIKKGNSTMLWGLITIFVMFSIYGLINLGQNVFFNKEDVSTIKIPDIR